MTPELLLAVVVFCFAGSMTPGPNNLLLLASGVNYGFARTLPHIAGVIVGYSVLLLAMGLGLAGALKAVPGLHTALKIGGALYLLWLAWKIANAGPMDEAREGGRPMTFVQAVAFQWINAKGVLLAVSAIAAFTRPDAFGVTLAALIAVATAASCLSTVTWTLFGSALRRVLGDPDRVRPFNIAMALLLVASLYPLIVD